MEPTSLKDWLAHGWNLFLNRDPTYEKPPLDSNLYYSNISPYRSAQNVVGRYNVMASIFNRIAVDASMIGIRHIRLDPEGRFKEYINGPLDQCLSLSANLDQTGRALMIDAILTMFDEGHSVIVPTETTYDPNKGNSYEISQMRVGVVRVWHKDHVTVNLYNPEKGVREDKVLRKENVAIIENPFYIIMNEPNSTLQRLLAKIALLDISDQRTATGKLDVLIQLPYTLKSEAKQEQAETRRKNLENQLSNAQLGIGYIDSTEKVIQLNRPIDNTLVSQVENLTRMLYSQLGLTPEIIDGTADEAAKLNYFTGTVEPILATITDELKRKFLTPTARTQNQTIRYFRDPFKLVPITQIADIADKFTRNEILTPNEIRTDVVGFKPSTDPEANKLRNRNINQAKMGPGGKQTSEEPAPEEPKDKKSEILSRFEKLIE